MKTNDSRRPSCSHPVVRVISPVREREELEPWLVCVSCGALRHWHPVEAGAGNRPREWGQGYQDDCLSKVPADRHEGIALRFGAPVSLAEADRVARVAWTAWVMASPHLRLLYGMAEVREDENGKLWMRK